MNIANIVVNQTTGICTMRKRIPAGASGLTVTVHFADPLWERLEKTVVFRGRELEKIADRFDGTTAIIPAEVIAEPDTALYFGIWGHEPEGILQLPLIEVRLGTTERATQPGSDPEADPDLPIWAKLQDDIDDLRELVESGTGTGGGGLKVTVVQTLPTENISTDTIYLVPDAQDQENVYTEYLYVNGEWEIVGSQQLDLTGYVKSINGVKPDPETGDVKISIPDSGGNVDFQIGETLKLENGILSVNTTNDMEQDNTLPITSAGVFATVGNIEALLKTI